MPKQVQVGEDILEFPDDMSDSDIEAVLTKEYPAETEQPDNASPEERPLKADNSLGFRTAAVRPHNNVALWMLRGLENLVGKQRAGQIDRAINSVAGLPGTEQIQQNEEEVLKKAAAEGRRPGLAGEIAGGMLSTAPLVAITKNPAMLGAVQGAINTKDPEDPGAVGTDAALGSAFSWGGDAAARSLGAVIAPRLDPMVRYLIDRGVKLTPGQTLGGVTHRFEDAMRSVYGIGDMIIGSQAAAQKSMNRAAVQETLDDIGLKIPDSLPEGHDMVKYAGDKLSDTYEAILKQTKPRLDAIFGQNVANLRQMAAGLPQDQSHVFESFIQSELKPIFNRNTGITSGEAFKKADEILGKKIRNFSRSASPHDRDLSGAFMELQSELRDIVKRQYPQFAQTIDGLNSGWAKLVRIEHAAAPTDQGVFTGPGLRQATHVADRSMRHRASARGKALMQDFGKAASTVMRPTMGDSGTVQRGIATALAAAALTGRLPMAGSGPNPWMAALLGSMSLPYAGTKAGDITRRLIAGAPGPRAAVRQVVDRLRLPSAMAGAQVGSRQRPRE